MTFRAALFLAVLWAVSGTVGIAPAQAQEQTYDTFYSKAVELRQEGDLVLAEERLRQALELRPDGIDALLLLGLVQGYQGKYGDAAGTLERGLALDPGNTDLALALARVMGWDGRHREAGDIVEEVLRRFPDNVEAVVLNGRLAYYQGHLDAAEEAFRAALALDAGNREAAAGLREVQAAQEETERAEEPSRETPWRIDASYANSALTRLARKDWHEGFWQLGYDISSETFVYAGGQWSMRAGDTDHQGHAGASHDFLPWLSGRGELALTPSADFLPRWDVKAGLSARAHSGGDTLGDTWIVLDARQRHYKTGDVRDFNPGFEQYLLDGRLWLTGRWLHSYDDDTAKNMNGWSARIDADPIDWLHVYVGRSLAPEIVSGRAVDIFATFGGLIVEVTPLLSLRVDYAREKRDASYIRDQVSAGFTARF